MTFERIKAIQEKEGWIGVVAYVFLNLHNGIFTKMTDSELKEFLSEVESNEDSKGAYIFYKEIVWLEEKYRATKGGIYEKDINNLSSTSNAAHGDPSLSN